MKRLLIVVDYQNDFVDGSLGFEAAKELDDRIATKIAEYRNTENLVCFVKDSHNKEYRRTLEGKNLPIDHCIEGTEGIELYGKVGESYRSTDMVFFKSSFGSKALFSRLSKLQELADSLNRFPFASIELVGLVTNMCLISNAILVQAACPNVPIIVDASCTASPDEELHEKTLDVMKSMYINIINRKKA